MVPTTNSDKPALRAVSLRESFWTWCRVAALSFGGPAGQIAVMHRIIVDEKKWVGEERFLHALNYCMLLPGPEAQQLATYIGWLMHRARGGLMAGILFILPGFVSILALSIVYAVYQQTDFVQAIFFGLKPAVVAIVFEAVLRISRRVLKNGAMLTIAALSFIAIFFFNVPFPLLIGVAGLVGFIGGHFDPQRFVIIKGHGAQQHADAAPIAEAVLDDLPPTLARSIQVSVICLTLWFGPLIAIALLLGPQSVLLQEGIFFSKAAMVTFGGAYSVLSYVGQQAVEKFAWLQPKEMLDGLGLAETTPGPLIMVVQFVGFLGAYRHPGPAGPARRRHPWLAGDDLGHLRAVLLLDIPRRPVHRTPARQSLALGGAVGDHGGGGRRDFELGDLVFAAHAVQRSGDAHVFSAAIAVTES